MYEISSQTKDFELLDQIIPKRILPVYNGKIKHYQWIQHIWVSLCIKFNLHQTALSFRIKLAQKRYRNGRIWNSVLTGSRNIGVFHLPYVIRILRVRKKLVEYFPIKFLPSGFIKYQKCQNSHVTMTLSISNVFC